MGGFATNGVNMTKLESYQLEGQFSATQFYADIEGHPSERNVRLALEELEFFTSYLRVLGVYKASPLPRRDRAPHGRCAQDPPEAPGRTSSCAIAIGIGRVEPLRMRALQHHPGFLAVEPARVLQFLLVER